MMSKMGHKAGKGLGKAAQGIASPLAAVGRPGTRGGGPGVGFGSLLKTPNALQSKAIEAAKKGVNIFITGPAGTGKSVVLSHIMHHLKTKYRSNPSKYVAVAPTGPTAISVGGQTIHSFAGCGVPETAKDFEKVWDKKNRKNWRDLEVMVIEE
jgi:Cdc6-like AAA superfamily ATPase